MENSCQILTREQLIEALWDIDGNFVDENTVAVNIRRLRQKVEDNPSNPDYIKNIRGIGYTFEKRCMKK
jgi:two-component system, OmpR family, response regulator VicR